MGLQGYSIFIGIYFMKYFQSPAVYSAVVEHKSKPMEKPMEVCDIACNFRVKSTVVDSQCLKFWRSRVMLPAAAQAAEAHT